MGTLLLGNGEGKRNNENIKTKSAVLITQRKDKLQTKEVTVNETRYV